MDKIFKPQYQFELLRIGSPHDGGYLVERNSHENSEFLLGLGINDDWTFEKDFDRPFIGVDNVLSVEYLLKRLLMKFGKILYQPFRSTSYQEFFTHLKKINYYRENKDLFIRNFVASFDSEDTIAFGTLLESIDSDKIYLKIDIEGSEYRILDEILSIEDRIEGMVFEFHDCDLHADKIKDFIERSSLTLVHIHPNNYGGVDENGDPLVIELTFAKNPKVISEEPPILPHELDTPNGKDLKDIEMFFL